MKYQNPKFSVGGGGSKAYDEGWDRTFGKGKAPVSDVEFDPLAVTAVEVEFNPTDGFLCRPGNHVRPCGQTGVPDECACGCVADDVGGACWA